MPRPHTAPMRRRLALAAATLVAGCGAAPSPAPAPGLPAPSLPAPGLPATVDYHLAPSPDLRGLEETLCFPGGAPAALVPGTSAGWAGLQAARVVQGAEIPLPAVRGPEAALTLPTLPPGACVALQVSLPEAPGGAGIPYAIRSASAVIVPVGDWLWRPWRLTTDFQATARLRLPPGMAASVPWTPDASGQGYTLPLGAFRRPGLAGFAAADSPAIVRRDLPGGTLEILAGPPEALPALPVLVDWVETAAREMTSLFGRFRDGRLQVIVRGVPSLEAVPFGQTFRGGGASVAMLVSRGLDAEAARADWVAIHEMFHTALPAMRPEDAWLYEGLASYYQNVLRARGGRATPAAAWQALADGFRRGRGAQTGRTLADESRDMRRTHAYWSVYWGGALWALRMDRALAARRPGRGGLDEVMRLWATFEERAEPWAASDLLAAADAALGLDGLLSGDAATTLASTRFFDFSEAEAPDWPGGGPDAGPIGTD
jgi:hypothetical protein